MIDAKRGDKPVLFGRGVRCGNRTRPVVLLAVIGALASVPPRQAAAQTSSPSAAPESSVQLAQPAAPGPAGAPVTVTLQDALARAQKNDAQFMAALGDEKS